MFKTLFREMHGYYRSFDGTDFNAIEVHNAVLAHGVICAHEMGVPAWFEQNGGRMMGCVIRSLLKSRPILILGCRRD